MANYDSSVTPVDADAMSASAPVDALIDDVHSGEHSFDSGSHNDVSSGEDNRNDIAELKAMYPNLSNMASWTDREKASQAGKVGGAKAGVTKRKRKLMREAAQTILSADLTKLPIPELEDLRLALKALGVDDATGADVILLAQSIKAARGDTEAARFVRDTSGEKPSVAVDVTASDRAIDADSVAQLTDAELIALADSAEDAHALPPPMLQ